MLLAVLSGVLRCVDTLILAARPGAARLDIADKSPGLPLPRAPSPRLARPLVLRSGALRIAVKFMLAARIGAARPGTSDPFRSSTVTSPCDPLVSVDLPGICRLKLVVRSGVTRKALALIARAGTLLCGSPCIAARLSSLCTADAICLKPVLLSMRCTRNELRPAALMLTARPGALRPTMLSRCSTVTLFGSSLTPIVRLPGAIREKLVARSGVTRRVFELVLCGTALLGGSVSGGGGGKRA